ncbi:MAG: DUF3341 domain-containing protein [Flavobacteriales bacterium]|nr:DUF3341 domain-containing protein [Flavobacteriales bacterium]
MLEKELILGVYDDGDKLLNAVHKLRKKGVEIFDCYTPYPVHNLDKEMGINRSNLTVGAFICGFLGFISGLLLQFYMMTNELHTFKSWPMIIGGKPQDYTVLPSMIPVTFELTVLFTAFGMAFLFFAKSRMIHGKIAEIVDPRVTNDRLFVGIEPSALHGISRSELDAIMNETGALEIRNYNGSSEVNTSSAEASQPKVEESKVVETSADLSEEERTEKMSFLKSVVGEFSADNMDDLKQINGVGPVYEKQLHELGIYSFEQVAKLTADAIKSIEDLTKYFPGKIEREDWVGQAKNLMNK